MSSSKDVDVKKNNALATVDIEKFADQGFDNIDSKSLQLPFLKILSQLSPQVTQGDSKFIEKARPGMIINTVTDKTTRGDDGKDRLQNGNYIEETASHYVVICEEQMATEALITMKSTQRKKSKKWNSMMNLMQVPKKNGKGFFRPAPFTQLYRLKTVLEKNNLGSWYGWEITSEGTCDNQGLVERAAKFRESVMGGSVKVKHNKEEQQEKTPF